MTVCRAPRHRKIRSRERLIFRLRSPILLGLVILSVGSEALLDSLEQFGPGGGGDQHPGSQVVLDPEHIPVQKPEGT